MNPAEMLTLRNQPIISDTVQKLIAAKRVLFAGCGLGSCIAESFARLGVRSFILIDNDGIEAHNLNRQSFDFKDIGQQKVGALKSRILSINPTARVTESPEWLTFQNAKAHVSQCDVIIDTIDFLDLSAIISLHDEALAQKKPVISLFTAGWGAVGILIPPTKDGPCWAREIFQVQPGQTDKMSYTKSFMSFFAKIRDKLNPDVGVMMDDVFKKMLDNKPCPAPNVIGGAQSAAILAQKLYVDYLAGKSGPVAPDFVYLDLEKVFSNSVLKVI